jgi:hypothetical protein
VVIVLVLGMFVLALFVNPGRALPQPAVDGRTFWYTRFATSNHRSLTLSARCISRGHRVARFTARRSVATANWLLGR